MAVLTATVVPPAPPFEFITVKMRARPEEVRPLLREAVKRVKASIRASEVASRSRNSPAPARIAATMVGGWFISPTAKIAISLVFA